MEAKYTWINGKFIPSAEAKIHVSDLAIQRGYGIFDFLKIVDNQPLFIDDYLDRFYHSAKEMFLPVKYGRETLKQIVQELIGINALPHSGIRLELTGGYSKDAYTIAEPNFMLIQQPLKLSETIASTGLKLKTYPHQRQLPHIKTIDYLISIRTLSSDGYRDVDDILYFNAQSVTECPRANFFIVTKQGTLKTAKEQILSGITRKHLIDLAAGHIPVEIGHMTLEETYGAKEAFVSSTTKNVAPVTMIDNQLIGDGQIGPVTKKLFDLLQGHIKEQIPAHSD